MKNQLEGMQAWLEVAYRQEQVSAQQAAGVRREDLGRGVAEEVALARGVSAKKAADQLAVRRVLVESLPRVFDHVMTGGVKPWTAEQAAQVALVLDDADRDRLDAELAPKITDLNPGSARGVARRIADRLDQDAAVARLRRCEGKRHVGIRAVADGMVRLSALLPTPAGVAVYATLTRLAATAPATGEGKSKGQAMADALVERVTGATDPGAVPVEVQLLMTDRTLLGDADDTALLDGQPIPADAARALALRTGAAGARGSGTSSDPARFVRRLFTDPVTGQLTGMDARRRGFAGAVREFIRARDQRCRVPYCGAPIRDIDHVERFADGGQTTIANGVGMCQRHNLAKEMPGWNARIINDPGSDAIGAGAQHIGGTLRLTTPSGITMDSPVPNLHDLTGRPYGAAPSRQEAPPERAAQPVRGAPPELGGRTGSAEPDPEQKSPHAAESPPGMAVRTALETAPRQWIPPAWKAPARANSRRQGAEPGENPGTSHAEHKQRRRIRGRHTVIIGETVPESVSSTPVGPAQQEAPPDWDGPPPSLLAPFLDDERYIEEADVVNDSLSDAELADLMRRSEEIWGISA